jgi:hypothetical protein
MFQVATACFSCHPTDLNWSKLSPHPPTMETAKLLNFQIIIPAFNNKKIRNYSLCVIELLPLIILTSSFSLYSYQKEERALPGNLRTERYSSPWWWRQYNLWNVGKLIPVYMALQLRRQPTLRYSFSNSPPLVMCLSLLPHNFSLCFYPSATIQTLSLSLWIQRVNKNWHICSDDIKHTHATYYLLPVTSNYNTSKTYNCMGWEKESMMYSSTCNITYNQCRPNIKRQN